MIIKTLARKWLPLSVIEVLLWISKFSYEIKWSDKLRLNYTMKDRHKNARCFILGNSPSLNDCDLTKLAGEVVFSLSNGYFHPDFPIYTPRYHCIPSLTFSSIEGGLTPDKAIAWFEQMDESIGNADIFLDLNDFKLVTDNRLFKSRKIIWYHTHRAASKEFNIDMTRCIPGVASAPQLAISIAIYMGFKEIILLGIDHDFFSVRRYDYFFSRKMMPFKDPSVRDDGTLKDSVIDLLRIGLNLFTGYVHLKHIADNMGITIVNCSTHSFLDVFDAGNFDQFVSHDNSEQFDIPTC